MTTRRIGLVVCSLLVLVSGLVACRAVWGFEDLSLGVDATSPIDDGGIAGEVGDAFVGTCQPGFTFAKPLPAEAGWFRVAFAFGVDLGISCGAGYGPRTDVRVVRDGGLNPASCGCSCDQSSGACYIGTATSGSACGANRSASPGPCYQFPPNTYDMNALDVCLVTSTSIIPETFEDTTAYTCEVIAPAPATRSGSCMPEPVAGLQSCIAKGITAAGVTVDCPPPYKRTLAALGVTDTRACSKCVCGASCGPLRVYQDGTNCTTLVKMAPETCSTQTLTAGASAVAMTTKPACGLKDGGTPTGSASLSGGVLVCCP